VDRGEAINLLPNNRRLNQDPSESSSVPGQAQPANSRHHPGSTTLCVVNPEKLALTRTARPNDLRSVFCSA
jgi:hypothetical protein